MNNKDKKNDDINDTSDHSISKQDESTVSDKDKISTNTQGEKPQLKLERTDYSSNKSIEVIQSRIAGQPSQLNEIAKGELGFILSDAVLNSANAKVVTDEELVGYIVPYNSVFRTEDGLKFRFEFKSTIPNFFLQKVVYRLSPTDSRYLNNPVSNVLSPVPQVVTVSNEVYNSTTSVVLLELKPTNLGIDGDLLTQFNQTLEMTAGLIFVNTDPQQRVNDLLLSNIVLKLFTLMANLDFILYDIEYQTIGSSLNTTSIGDLLLNKEILTEGQPHILTISTSFENQNIVSAIRKAVTVGSELSVSTGVKEGSRKLINSIPYRYDGYAFIDQYAAYINNSNCKYILDNKLRYSDFINELKPFLTKNASIVDENLPIYFDERVLLTKLQPQLNLNYIFTYFLIPGMHLRVSDFIISQLGAVNLVIGELAITGLLNQGFGKTDSTAINDILGPIKSTPSMSILTLITCEALRNVENFKVNGDITCTDSNLTTHLYNIYLCARFFPYCFSQLLYQYLPTLYTIIQTISPSDILWLDNEYGRYGRIVDNKWERLQISSYTRGQQEDGVLPSLYALIMSKKAPKMIKQLNSLIQPIFYDYHLNRRKESNYPFITSNYVYYSSWPIGGPYVDEIANEFVTRISVECREINAILMLHYRGVRGSTKSRSSTTLKALTDILAGFMTIFTEAATVFTRIVGPTFARFFQNPIVPGTIVEVLLTRKLKLTQHLPSKRIGISATKLDRNYAEHDLMGYTSGAVCMQVNTMQFVNLLLSITTRQGRGAILFDGSDTNFDYYDVVPIDPVALYEFYLSAVESSRKACQSLYTFQIFIDSSLNPEFYEIIQPYLPRVLPSSLAKSILKFLSSKLKINTEELYTIYSSTLGTKILTDPRSCRLRLGVIEGCSLVAYDNIVGTIIGRDFELVDKLYTDKLRLIIHMLTSRDIPNLQLSTGLAVGMFPTENPRVTDYLVERPFINYYKTNETFKLQSVVQPGFDSYRTSRLIYYYKINDEEFTAEAVEMIKHKHTVICRYPTDITAQAQKDFLIQAALLDKIILIFDGVIFTWSIDLPSAIHPNTYVGNDTINQLQNLTYSDSTVKVHLIMHDGRDIVSFNPYDVTGVLIRRVLPLNSLRDNIIVSGLFDSLRATEPYIHRNFFTLGIDNVVDEYFPINEFPNNDNLVRIHTKACILERPRVEIKYAKEFE